MLSDLRCRAAEIAPADRRLDRDAARAGFAADRRGTERLGHVGELPERNLVAVVAVDQQRANGVEACRADRRAGGRRDRSGAGRSRSATASSPTSPIRTARITSPGASPTRAVASRLTAICSCGSPVSCSARKSAMPVDASDQRLRPARRVATARRDPGRRFGRRDPPACRRAPRRCACPAVS